MLLHTTDHRQMDIITYTIMHVLSCCITNINMHWLQPTSTVCSFFYCYMYFCLLQSIIINIKRFYSSSGCIKSLQGCSFSKADSWSWAPKLSTLENVKNYFYICTYLTVYKKYYLCDKLSHPLFLFTSLKVIHYLTEIGSPNFIFFLYFVM